jgi:hypothetical protein
MSDVPKLTAFTPAYEQKCFAVWFELGRMGYAKIIDKLPEDEYGRKPSRNVFLSWRNTNDWDGRADEIEAKAAMVVDDELLNDRIIMVKQQAARAKELQEYGMDYLREEGFDSAASAVSAVIKGAELERQSRGLGNLLMKMSEMDNEKLQGTVNAYLQRANAPDVIDVAEIPDGEEDDNEEEEE